MRALIGVSDRTGLIDFAAGLRECGVELFATDGTRRALADAGVEARPVSDLTGMPELLDGRVKTLHPAIHGGILARRDHPAHLRTLDEQGWVPIDIVCVSLYPFAEAVAAGADRETATEKIDIGGPTMIRAAAKNAVAVAVVVSSEQYAPVLAELRSEGEVRAATRRRLAAEAFAHVAAYDTAVAAWLTAEEPAEELPASFTTGGPLLHTLRYGENPHQRGALYRVPGAPSGVAGATLHQGSQLSFTNWLDVDAARRLVLEFEEPAAAVIKHTNPCGFATGADIACAYRRAHDCDPRSAFGGIVALNGELDLATVREIGTSFLEAVIAPSVTAEALEQLQSRPRVRVLTAPAALSGGWDVRSIDGGLLVQTQDRVPLDRAAMRVATRRQPDEEQWQQLLLAWRVCRHVKSNAIVVVRDGQAVGVGAGQMSRVEAAQLAVARAGDRVSGAVAASDAFFPMPDGLEMLTEAGVVAVIQPGGSKGDGDVIAAADAAGAVMVLAGERHFRH